MRKYSLLLDPVQVDGLRQKARQLAAESKKDVTWVSLLRAAVASMLSTYKVGQPTPIQNEAQK